MAAAYGRKRRHPPLQQHTRPQAVGKEAYILVYKHTHIQQNMTASNQKRNRLLYSTCNNTRAPKPTGQTNHAKHVTPGGRPSRQEGALRSGQVRSGQGNEPLQPYSEIVQEISHFSNHIIIIMNTAATAAAKGRAFSQDRRPARCIIITD